MNQITIFHSSPSDFLHTKDESIDDSINTYLEYKKLGEECQKHAPFVTKTAILAANLRIIIETLTLFTEIFEK